MGLIRAVLGSALGTLADEWLEFIDCDALSGDVLMQKGAARVGGRSGNTGRDANVISDGSKIAVNEGQCLLVVENGKIVDFCAEPGGYLYQTGTEPSLFDGGNHTLADSFQKMGRRFQAGGQPMNDQRVYSVNTKEILDNKIGIGDVPFRDGEFNITLMLRGYGLYGFRITDPVRFYTNVCANVTDSFPRASLEKQLRGEMQAALFQALGKIAQRNIRYDQLPLMTDDIAALLRQELNGAWKEKRGLEISSLSLTSIRPREASVQKIQQLQESTLYAGSAPMLGARIGAAQANAMETAAANPGGAAGGLMGMSFAMGAGGVNANALLGQTAPTQPAAGGPAEAAETWTCACGAVNTLRFCVECGKPRPASAEKWVCACGHLCKGKFCGACGSPRPRKLKCDKCGYAFENLQKPPKFCPQCGDPVDEKDIVS